MILPLNSKRATLDNVGGKGANLATLARSGLRVPPAFMVTTQAYRQFVTTNDLEAAINGSLIEADLGDPASLEGASQSIRQAFSTGQIPNEIERMILEAYHGMSSSPVAVRSSATAEDLPGMSFAGQQDTFLNVIGDPALLEAVVNCWSSLWTARAIGYRERNKVPHAEAALAIVVQEMVPAQVSGVLFSANPLSGLRAEMVIDVTFGLGEALVSGKVQPDHYVVNLPDNRIVTKTLGAKAISIRGKEGGGLETIDEPTHDRQALSDDQIMELTDMGKYVQAIFDFPQDIEWALYDGDFYMLQSRPITSLFPIPQGLGDEKLHVMFSFAAVQGMYGPITPLGRDALCMAFAGAAALFGLQRTYENQGALRIAGERLWVDITSVVYNKVGQKVLRVAIPLLEPTIVQPLETLWRDNLTSDKLGMPRPGTFFQLLRFGFSIFRRVIPAFFNPDRFRESVSNETEGLLDELRDRAGDIQGDTSTCLSQRMELLDFILPGFSFFITRYIPAIFVGMATMNLLDHFARGIPSDDANSESDLSVLTMQLTRGIPNNVTTEMDLYLWKSAKRIKTDPESTDIFLEEKPDDLAQRFHDQALPPEGQEVVSTFLDRYGMRAVGEIDISRSRWSDDPTHIMGVLQNYLRIEDEDRAPDVVFERSAREAESAIEKLVDAVSRTNGGRLKARLVRFAAGRMRSLLGLREMPKFMLMRMLAIQRKGLLSSGEDMVAEGVFDQPDDIFYLHPDELANLAEGDERDWREIIISRRMLYEREKLRRQLPRLLLSDGRAFYEGLSAPEEEEGVLVGSAVSPGLVEGVVHVIFDPLEEQLAPGEILVCQGTDPAWTPLFLAAGGLITEVGGMMTHGSLVAREYGIPAVVGVHEATSRLKTGQRVRVDGSAGRVVVL